jgi:hypothetical protein
MALFGCGMYAHALAAYQGEVLIICRERKVHLHQRPYSRCTEQHLDRKWYYFSFAHCSWDLGRYMWLLLYECQCPVLGHARSSNVCPVSCGGSVPDSPHHSHSLVPFSLSTVLSICSVCFLFLHSFQEHNPLCIIRVTCTSKYIGFVIVSLKINNWCK